MHTQSFRPNTNTVSVSDFCGTSVFGIHSLSFDFIFNIS